MVNLLQDIAYPFVLASASPRRQELIKSLGITPIISPANIDETIPNELIQAEEVARFLALEKAKHIAAIHKHHIVIGADTVVQFNHRFLEKPQNKQQATEFLTTLSGQTHTVVSGVALIYNQLIHTFSETTYVTFGHLSPRVIEHYIEHCNPYDKAGGYGIQEWIGTIGVKRINGCYQNVIGFPLARFVEEVLSFHKTIT